MQIPFFDIKKLNAPYKNAFKMALNSFLDTGYYILGNSVKEFETEFAKYCGAKYCVGTGNGLDALTLILKASIELGRLNFGDQIIVAANTYIATLLAIENAGLKPLLAEVNENTFNLDIQLLPKKNSKKVKGVMVTHLYGQLADMDGINAYCKNNNLLLFSDAAQAHGATAANGKKAGNLCLASGFSFYPTKNLGALGDAGAITTNDKDLFECTLKLRNYGGHIKYQYEYKGVNSRLDELQAKFLSIKLKDLGLHNSKRKYIAKRYIKEIKNSKIILPQTENFDSHVFHQFVIKTTHREAFISHLDKYGIGSLIHYPIPPHKQACYKNELKDTFSTTEKLSESVLSLPISPALTELEVNYIIEKINLY